MQNCSASSLQSAQRQSISALNKVCISKNGIQIQIFIHIEENGLRFFFLSSFLLRLVFNDQLQLVRIYDRHYHQSVQTNNAFTILYALGEWQTEKHTLSHVSWHCEIFLLFKNKSRLKINFCVFRSSFPYSPLPTNTESIKHILILFLNLIFPHLVKKFIIIQGTRNVITVFTRPRHFTLSRARSVQSKTSHSISSRFISILYSNLRNG